MMGYFSPDALVWRWQTTSAFGQRVLKKKIFRSVMPYGPATRFIISGHLGLDPATGRPPASATDEARMMLDAFKKTVETAGLTMQDLVFMQIFCSDVRLFSEFNAVYRTYFNSGYPARAFLGSGKLLFDARFEIQGIAVKRS